MSDLEARIAEVVSTHLEHHGDEYDLRLSASIRKLGGEVATMLAPVIREAQAESWDECVHVYDSMVCLDCEPKAPTNPYHADNLATP